MENDGLSPATAIVIDGAKGRDHRIISDYLDRMFGANDGEYLVLSEQERTDKLHRPNQLFKIMYVEVTPPRGKSYKRSIFFDISGWTY